MGKETSYKHPGYIQGITQISDSKFLSYCSAGNVIAYDLERHRKFKINEIEMEDEKENWIYDFISHNNSYFLGVKDRKDEWILRDMHKDFSLVGKISLFEDESRILPVMQEAPKNVWKITSKE